VTIRVSSDVSSVWWTFSAALLAERLPSVVTRRFCCKALQVLQRFAQASLAECHWFGIAADNAVVGINLTTIQLIDS
jgi:hypothetical protein